MIDKEEIARYQDIRAITNLMLKINRDSYCTPQLGIVKPILAIISIYNIQGFGEVLLIWPTVFIGKNITGNYSLPKIT